MAYKGTKINQSSSQKRLDELEKQKASLDENSAAFKKIDETIKQINAKLESSVENIEDFSDSVKSIGAGLGKNNKLFESMSLLSASMQGSMKSVGLFVKELGTDASKFKKETFKTADAYKSLGNVIAVNIKKLKKQQITTSQYNESVLNGYEDLEEQIDRLESQMEGLTGQSLKSAQAIKRTFETQKDSLEAAAKAAEKSKKNLEGMAFTLDTISSTGIPAMSELGSVITKAAEGGMGLTLAFAALGAALGKMAYDLGFVGDKLGTIASYDKKLAGLKGQIDAINQQVTLGIFGGRNFVKESAILDFSNTVTQMGIEFEAASKTALFGEKLGGVGYGAAQLQMAGIAAETIATAMKDASSAMGSNVSGEFGADMAILAARTGQTSEGIASISDTFMRLDGVSKEMSLNMQEGLRTMAKQADVNLGALMEDVAAASKDALSYQIKSGPALAKAATFAASLGTKFTDIANAGKSMVLNYKDSIKAEMSLSAMLGKRVDLSQVRALFAAGRTEDAIKALKAQGLDPSKMNLFQQEALKNATGGLDLNSLQKIATRTGRTGGELEGEKVKVGNGTFILSKNAAESAKAVGSAVASAMTAVQQTLLESNAEKARQTAIENNTQGLKDLMNSLNRTEMMKTIATGFGAAIPMLIGGLLMYKLGPKMISGAMTTALTNAGIGGAGAASAGAAGAAAGGSSILSGAKPEFGARVGSNLKGGVRGMGGILTAVFAAMEYKDRKDAGQTTLQAGAGAAGGAGGALAGAAIGTAILPIFGTLVGGMLGYMGGSSLADTLTGANEPAIEAQQNTELALTEGQLAQAKASGDLLSDTAYTIELQKEMVAELGLATTLLYDIAENNRGLFQSVNIDGKKVMEALQSTSRKQFGVARNYATTTVAARK